MPTLLDTVRGLVTPQLVSRLASSSGESSATVNSGLTAAVPMLLGAIADQSDDRTFMTRLMSMATDPAAETPLSSSSAAGPVVQTEDSSLTSRLLSLVSGGSPARMVDTLGRSTGLNASTAGALLSAAGSFVLAALAKLVRTDRLDAGALASRLRSERSSYAGAIPGTTTADYGVPPGPARAVGTYEPPRASTPWRWVIPVVLAALALWGLSTILGRRGDDRAMRTGTPGAVATTGAEMLTVTLPSGTSLRYPRGFAEDRLIKGLQGSSRSDAWIAFDRIGFVSGSAALTPESQAQLRNIAVILQAYPNARVMIGAYTDNSGDEAANLQLSRDRAAAVRDALQAAGVNGSRLEAEGYGEQNPIASNDTEAGREKNRRVAFRVETR